MKKIFLTCFIPLSFAWNSTSTGADNKTTNESEKIAVGDDLESICKRFYTEVCMTQLASPDAILHESGYYVLDLAAHKSALEKTGMFTDGFIAMQDLVFDECKRALEKDQLTPEDVWEGGIEMNGPAPCSFMDYAYYFHAQEDPDTFKLKKTSVKENMASTEMHFYSANYHWGHYLSIGLKKLDGSWYIDNVEKKSE